MTLYQNVSYTSVTTGITYFGIITEVKPPRFRFKGAPLQRCNGEIWDAYFEEKDLK